MLILTAAEFGNSAELTMDGQMQDTHKCKGRAKMAADVIAERYGWTKAEERTNHRKKNKRQLERDRIQAHEKAEEAKREAEAANQKALQAEADARQAMNNFFIVQDDIIKGKQQLEGINAEKEKAQDELSALEEKARVLAEAVGEPTETVEVTGFCDTVFAYNSSSSGVVIANLQEKGKSKVKMMDVIMAAFEELEKVKDRKKPLFMDTDEFKRSQNHEIKSIMTDMQTILRSFSSAHVQELTRRSRSIVKQELRQNAVAIRKIREYDEMKEIGINKETYMAAEAKAEKFDKARKVLDALWKGLWDTVEALIDPNLDKYEMDASGKETVRNALSKDAKERLTEAGWLLKLVNAVRNIDPRTETEVWEIGAESGVEYLKNLGLDMAEGVVNDIEGVAATTACRDPSRDTR